MFASFPLSILIGLLEHSDPTIQVCLTFTGEMHRRNSRDVCSVDGQGDKQKDCP